MANKYWAGGSGTWDATSTAHWSDSPTGIPTGASVPTNTDDVFFTSVSSATSYAVDLDNSGGTLSCRSLSISGPASGTLTFSNTGYGPYVYGDLTISATGVVASLATPVLFSATTATISTNNVPVDTVQINGGGTFTLGSAFTGSLFIGSSNYPTFNTSNFNVTCPAIIGIFTTASGAGVTLNLGTSTLTFSGLASSFIATNASSVSAASATFVMSGTNTNFNGNGFSYGTFTHSGVSKTTTISGSNTFATISNTVQPCTFNFTSGKTQTVTNFTVNGTSGNLVTIQSSSSGSASTLSKASGTVNSDYLSITDSTATGGAAWYAGANSTNGGNNTGWIFTASPSTSTGFLGLLLRKR